MRIIAGSVCVVVLLGSIGLMVPHTIDARSRKKDRENVEQTNERQEELREKIRALERQKRELEKLHAAQIQRDRRMKNVKMVDAEEVWHRCSVEVKAIDGQLDRGYIERQFRSYLSGIASIIKKMDKTGRYEMEGTVDSEGNLIALEVTEDSFRSDMLKTKLSELVSRLNYGRSWDGSQAKITLIIMRDAKVGGQVE